MRLTTTRDGRRPWPAADADARPLLEAEFDRLMQALGPFEQRPTLAIAVSGGPDSLALALLARRWAEARGGRIVGLTVDHGLRATSADEARQVGAWLRDHGIEHRTLPWAGEKPSTGVQQQARQARYRLLQSWCEEEGVLHLMTAHHRGDQAETVALRKARRSGPDGLAGMAAIRDLRGLRLLRPLLGIDKERLVATLRMTGQAWIDDPSNRNLDFTRNRLRHQGIDVAAHADLAARCGRRRQAAERRLNGALARFVRLDPAGFAVADDAIFETLPAGLAQTLVARVLMTIGGRVYPPGREGLERLAGAMRRDRPFAGRTLARCRVLKRKRSWLFCREPASAEALPLLAGRWQMFDDRFRLRLRTDEGGHAVRELGGEGLALRKHLIEKGFRRSIPAPARPALPSIWQDRTLLAIPHLGLFARGLDPSALDLEFWPVTPLANAPFAAHMLIRKTTSSLWSPVVSL